MKLAEALQERADLNRRIEQLRSRIGANALVQEGEKTAEDPNALLTELEQCAERLCALMSAINRTNCDTVVGGRSLTDMIAERDSKRVLLSVYHDTVDAASRAAQRATRSEIRILPALNVKALQEKADLLSKELRLLDNALQEQNWKTELIGL
ncbi:MAG: DIP1984 family protein [Clostridia bacterium]|nr:DIP1984 family protein [Clostridia bacterium]